jgi:hypothetical protein
MSLISQIDRAMTVEAIEFYIASMKTYHTPNQEKISQYYALLNWIKLEQSKNV